MQLFNIQPAVRQNKDGLMWQQCAGVIAADKGKAVDHRWISSFNCLGVYQRPPVHWSLRVKANMYTFGRA